MRRVNPADELTDPENELVLGTLTPAAWRGLSVEQIASIWYDPDLEVVHEYVPDVGDACRECGREPVKHLSELPSPSGLLIHEARRSSGAIGGEHRRDLKDALIGAPGVAAGLSVPVQPAQSGGEASGASKSKRGL